VQTIGCDFTNTPMKSYQSLQSNEIVAIQSESPAVVKATEWMKQILEAKYEKTTIKDVVAQCKHLSNTEQQHLFAVHWKNECYDLTFQPNAKPYHASHLLYPKYVRQL
jgi:DNA-binding transcriptional regulator YhcF (GntR family)